MFSVPLNLSFSPSSSTNYGGRSPKFIWAPCHVMCTAVLIDWDPATPPSPCIWIRITRALLVSEDRRHLFVTPWTNPSAAVQMLLARDHCLGLKVSWINKQTRLFIRNERAVLCWLSRFSRLNLGLKRCSLSLRTYCKLLMGSGEGLGALYW